MNEEILHAIINRFIFLEVLADISISFLNFKLFQIFQVVICWLQSFAKLFQ